MVAAVMFVLSLLALALTYQTPAAGLARLALTAALAMSLTRFFTPVVARAAVRCGIVDRPDGRLKLHATPVPYLGGLSLGLGFFISLSLGFLKVAILKVPILNSFADALHDLFRP